MNYKISIVTVNLNNTSGLEKTIRSIAERKNDSIQFIVVDGGSKDGSLGIIKKNIDVIDKYISEEDNGIFDAQNKGSYMAEGEYLLFINAGDLLIHDDIAGLLKSRNEDIIYGDLLIKTGKRTIRASYPEKLNKSFLYNESLPHPSTFIKRSVFEALKRYDSDFRIAADYEFFLNCYFSNCSFNYIGEIISEFEKGGVSSDESIGSRHQKERKAIHRKYFSFVERFFYKFFVVKKKINYLKYHLTEKS